MTHPHLSNLLSDTPMQFEDWKLWETWSPFAFNYNGSPSPVTGEVNVVKDAHITFHITDHLIHYLVSDKTADSSQKFARRINDPILIITLSTANSAHSISELISFINFYLSNDLDINIGVNSIIVKKLPFIFQLLELFVPADRIILIDSKYKYHVQEAWFRRNTHFNYIKNWTKIPYFQNGNEIQFSNLQSTRFNYIEDPSCILDMSQKIYDLAKDKYPLHDRIMLAKVKNPAEVMTTPGRAMEFNQTARSQLEQEGIKFLSINEFEGIEQYIATLYGAKVFITSYGGAACTNRFFVRPDAHVILLGNKQYSWEYEYPNDQGEHWHLRHSHLFPVERQTVLLYHNDIADQQDVTRIIHLANS